MSEPIMPAKRRPPSAALRRYVRAQALLRAEFQRQALDRLCAACPDPCCARASFRQLVEPEDATVLPSIATSGRVAAALPCCHLTSSGCDLPAFQRPWVCVAHTCDRWDATLSARGRRRLARKYVRLDAAFMALGHPAVPPA